jgi:ribosomal protein L4
MDYQLVFDVVDWDAHATDDIVLQMVVSVPDREHDLLQVVVRHVAARRPQHAVASAGKRDRRDGDREGERENVGCMCTI